MEYIVKKYAVDGSAGEYVPGGYSDGDVVAQGSMRECREKIASIIGRENMDMLQYTPCGDVEAIEAYHENMDEGCGGFEIIEI